MILINGKISCWNFQLTFFLIFFKPPSVFLQFSRIKKYSVININYWSQKSHGSSFSSPISASGMLTGTGLIGLFWTDFNTSGHIFQQFWFWETILQWPPVEQSWQGQLNSLISTKSVLIIPFSPGIIRIECIWRIPGIVLCKEIIFRFFERIQSK